MKSKRKKPEKDNFYSSHSGYYLEYTMRTLNVLILEELSKKRFPFTTKKKTFNTIKKNDYWLNENFFYKILLPKLESDGFITGWGRWIAITKRGKEILTNK